MKKKLLYTALGLMGIMGTLSMGVVSADTSCWGMGTVPISNYASGIVYGCDETNTPVITIYSQNKNYGITMANKNLGAFFAGTGLNSYGYYFQRGNNSAGDLTFYNGVQNNNRWGGGNDNDDTDENIVKGYDKVKHKATYVEHRQGPCSSGYHVPSEGEWQELVDLYKQGYELNNPSDESSWEKNELQHSNFSDDFLLPIAGRRESDGGICDAMDDNGYGYGYYWSSSPNSLGILSSNGAKDMNFGSDPLGRYLDPNDTSYRSYGLSVRCFKNLYITSPQPIKITYDPNGGAFSGKAVGETIVVTYNTGTYTPDINIQFPNKESDNMAAQSGWMFDGWYTTGVLEYQTTTTEWLGFVDENTESQTVYAKWLPFNDLPIEGTDYVIMDRNLGATDVWNYGDSETSVAKNGKYYQWGNNHGFPASNGNGNAYAYTSNTPVDASAYGPGNYYSSATFILRPEDNAEGWDTTNNANLWGGTSSRQSDKQGPCPAGYHVPTTAEWKAIYDALYLSEDSRIKLQTTLHLPMAGYRSRAGSDVLNQGSDGNYWSSSRYDASYAYNLYFFSFAMSSQSYSYHSNGFSVRCLKDSPTHTLTFNATENGASTTSQSSVEATQGSSVPLPSCNETKTGFTCIGWNTDATAHEGLASITLNEDKTVYAIFKKDLTATYTATNASISGNQTSGSCTLWNKDTSCSITLPSITCNAGYHTPAWTPENLDNVASDTGATASCTANDDTQYLVHYYQQNLSGTYDLFETYTGAGTTDTIATAVEKTYSGFAFSGTNTNNKLTGNIDGDGSLELKLYYDRGEYKLSFVVDGNVIQSGTVAYAAAITAPADPTKDCNAFAGWSSSVAGVTTAGTMPDSDVTFTANWNYTCSRSSGGGGSRKSSTAMQDSSTSSQNDTKTSDSGEQAKQGNVNTQNSSSESQNDGNTQQKTYSEEFQKAYGFAHESGITTMDTIEKAEMDQPLTRIAMAKMLSQYAINVLGKKPANITVPKFKDVSEKLDTEYDNGVTLAYQLGIMGINMKNNRFRPFDYVTRAEFATALSRLLFDTPDGKDVYYSTHLRQLMEKKIITNDDPRLQELRGYVMIMLMRSAED